ncbi:multiple inositol polyphosphate phosphatase 1-like [Chelonus insularis]|uniref:multiple inositol polyphosphate phosphatase 1-like n=1 Tax=Chelonus insularis TaxID=460826 RepID=UPI00158AC47E|nr:multiple inositol polyphosphate phosphatase 1-like [Chelonus insularis]
MNYLLLFTVLYFFVNKSFVVTLESINCIDNPDNFKCKFATIVPYRYIANYNDTEISIPDCEAQKIWFLIRHGTRFPSKKIIEEINNKLPALKQKILDNCKFKECFLNEKQLKNLIDWNLNIQEDQAMILANEGKNELIGLAERYQSRFPKLLPEKYKNSTYKFKFTASQRTNQSAKYFTIGLFGKRQSDQIYFPEPEEKDPILRFYKACDKWLKNVKKNPQALRELEEFKQSATMKTMLENMSQRLGFNVDFDDIKLMRSMCSFETAWNEQTKSPWCHILSPEAFEVMEFVDDLKYYWIDGYGFALTSEQACPALRDMFDFFKSNDELKISAYFTHSGTLLKVLSILGLAKDAEPLLQSSFRTSKNRQWRTSLIDAFATNMAFISYNCKSNGPSILVMHQERIVNLPGCPKNVPCPLNTMEEMYPDKKEECNFEDICSS